MKRKHKIEDITSTETGQSQKRDRRNAKRRAAIEIYEMPDGRVNIDYYDSQVNTSNLGQKRSFDMIAYMAQQYVFHRIKELIAQASLGCIQNYDQAPVDIQAALAKADSKLDQVRQLAVNIKTGKGGSEPDDPYKLQRKLYDILK